MKKSKVNKNATSICADTQMDVFGRIKKNHVGGRSIRKELNTAIRACSAANGIKPETVRDKLTRKIGVNTEELCALIEDYLNGGAALKEHLLSTIQERRYLADYKALNFFF